MAKLGEVCDFYAGTGFPNEYQGKVTGKYPFYKVGDISKNVLEGNRELKTCANYVEEDVVQKLKGSILPPKTIVFAKIGEALKLNRRAITSCECLVDNNVMGIKAQNVRLNDEYLFYWLQNLNLSDYSESTTVPSVKKSRLQNIEISVSPLEEQEKVVSTLNKLSSLILARKKQLSKLDELVKARFVEMFGDPVSNPLHWKKVKLSELADIKIGPFGSLLHKEDYVTGGHPLVNPSHIISGKIIVDNDLTLAEEKYFELSAYHLKKNDVILGRRGEMGRCAVVNEEGLLCGTGSLLIRTNGTVTADYIQKIISFPTFKKTIEDMAVGQTMPNLNVPIVSNFMIIVPPLSVQKNYYDFVERVDQQKQTVQQSLDKLELMKKAQMQEYFG